MNTPEPADWTWINGRMVPAPEAVIPVSDRGFLYGDSVFETVLIRHGRPFRWVAHLRRLVYDAGFLGIVPPPDGDLGEALRQVLSKNGALVGSVRLSLSRGSGRRGYSPQGADSPTTVVTWHPAVAGPARERWRLATAPLRLAAGDPLAGCKHGSRLTNVLARQFAEKHGADEALLLDTDGFVAETAAGNIFCLVADQLWTPPAAGLLPGITRACVLEIAPSIGLECVEERFTPAALHSADAVFFTTSTLGVAPVESLDGRPLGRPELTAPIAAALEAVVEKECG